MTNPYHPLPDTVRRINLPIPTNEYDTFKSVATRNTDPTSCVAVLFAALVARIRASAWTYDDRDKLTALVERVAASIAHN